MLANASVEIPGMHQKCRIPTERPVFGASIRGALFILVTLFLPDGVMGLLRKLRKGGAR